jgi:hypothetical protein
VLKAVRLRRRLARFRIAAPFAPRGLHAWLFHVPAELEPHGGQQLVAKLRLPARTEDHPLFLTFNQHMETLRTGRQQGLFDIEL